MSSYCSVVASLFNASLKAGLVVGFVFGVLLCRHLEQGNLTLESIIPIFGLTAFGMLLSPAFAFPSILFGAALLIYAVRRGFTKRHQFAILGLLSGGAYGLLLEIANIDLFPTVFFAGGGTLAGFFVHSEVGMSEFISTSISESSSNNSKGMQPCQHLPHKN